MKFDCRKTWTNYFARLRRSVQMGEIKGNSLTPSQKPFEETKDISETKM